MSPRLPGTVVHFDVCGPDGPSLTSFYSAVFGWKIAPKGPGYSLVETPEGGPNGAVVETESPSLTVSVVVADLDQAVREALARGGRIVLPATDNGWVKKAQVADPAGNTVTLLQG